MVAAAAAPNMTANILQQQCQVLDPRIPLQQQQQQQQQQLVPLIHTHFHQPSVLVPPNPYLHEEIPAWLRVYCKASPSLDHHLKWDLFELVELECYDSMLNRLFKDGLEEIVMRWVEILSSSMTWVRIY